MPKMAIITSIKTDKSLMDMVHMKIASTNKMEIKCRIIIQTTQPSPMEWMVQMAATSTL